MSQKGSQHLGAALHFLPRTRFQGTAERLLVLLPEVFGVLLQACLHQQEQAVGSQVRQLSVRLAETVQDRGRQSSGKRIFVAEDRLHQSFVLVVQEAVFQYFEEEDHRFGGQARGVPVGQVQRKQLVPALLYRAYVEQDVAEVEEARLSREQTVEQHQEEDPVLPLYEPQHAALLPREIHQQEGVQLEKQLVAAGRVLLLQLLPHLEDHLVLPLDHEGRQLLARSQVDKSADAHRLQGRLPQRVQHGLEGARGEQRGVVGRVRRVLQGHRKGLGQDCGVELVGQLEEGRQVGCSLRSAHYNDCQALRASCSSLGQTSSRSLSSRALTSSFALLLLRAISMFETSFLALLSSCLQFVMWVASSSLCGTIFGISPSLSCSVKQSVNPTRAGRLATLASISFFFSSTARSLLTARSMQSTLSIPQRMSRNLAFMSFQLSSGRSGSEASRFLNSSFFFSTYSSSRKVQNSARTLARSWCTALILRIVSFTFFSLSYSLIICPLFTDSMNFTSPSSWLRSRRQVYHRCARSVLLFSRSSAVFHDLPNFTLLLSSFRRLKACSLQKPLLARAIIRENIVLLISSYTYYTQYRNTFDNPPLMQAQSIGTATLRYIGHIDQWEIAYRQKSRSRTLPGRRTAAWKAQTTCPAWAPTLYRKSDDSITLCLPSAILLRKQPLPQGLPRLAPQLQGPGHVGHQQVGQEGQGCQRPYHPHQGVDHQSQAQDGQVVAAGQVFSVHLLVTERVDQKGSSQQHREYQCRPDPHQHSHQHQHPQAYYLAAVPAAPALGRVLQAGTAQRVEGQEVSRGVGGPAQPAELVAAVDAGHVVAALALDHRHPAPRTGSCLLVKLLELLLEYLVAGPALVLGPTAGYADHSATLSALAHLLARLNLDEVLATGPRTLSQQLLLPQLQLPSEPFQPSHVVRTGDAVQLQVGQRPVAGGALDSQYPAADRLLDVGAQTKVADPVILFLRRIVMLEKVISRRTLQAALALQSRRLSLQVDDASSLLNPIRLQLRLQLAHLQLAVSTSATTLSPGTALSVAGGSSRLLGTRSASRTPAGPASSRGCP